MFQMFQMFRRFGELVTPPVDFGLRRQRLKLSIAPQSPHSHRTENFIEVFILNLGQVGQGHDILWVNKNNGNKSKSTYIDFEDVNSHKDPTDANHSTKAPNVAMKEGQALLSQACANEAVKHTKNKNSLKTFMFKPKGTH